MKRSSQKKGSHDDIEATRNEALLELSQGMRHLIPQALAAARRNKPAMMRLVSRWFRMPPPERPSERELRLRAEDAERTYRAARNQRGWLEQEIEALKKEIARLKERTAQTGAVQNPLDSATKRP